MGKRRNSHHSWVDPHSSHEFVDLGLHFEDEKSNKMDNGFLPSDEPSENNLGTKFSVQENTYFPIAQRSNPNHTEVPSNEEGKTLHEFYSEQMNNEQKLKEKQDTSLLHKALEHIAVGFYVFGFVFAPILLTIAALSVFLFPPLWIFAVPYLFWLAYDWRTPCKGSRPWLAFRSLSLWNYMAQYFPMQLVKTAELSPEKNHIIGVHPHGILSFGAFLTFCTEAVGFAELYPGLKRRYAVTLPCQYWFPLRREFLQFSNTISSEMDSIDHVLGESERGTVVGIVAGGAAEALDSSPNSFKLTLKNRKGFIKVALKHGACLVPSYTFGETSAYKQVANPEGSRIRKIQNSLKNSIGITMPFFYGCGFFNRFFGWMPYRVSLNSVIGKPINVTKTKNPTNRQIDELHEKYLRELSKLFDSNKQKYGIEGNVKLEFV